MSDLSDLKNQSQASHDTLIRMETLITEKIVPLIESHEEELNGNGGPGIIRQLDRLVVSEKKRSRLLWVIITGVVVVAVKSFFPTIIGG